MRRSRKSSTLMVRVIIMFMFIFMFMYCRRVKKMHTMICLLNFISFLFFFFPVFHFQKQKGGNQCGNNILVMIH